MHTKQVICFWVLTGLIAAAAVCFLLATFAPGYTAHAFIRVLPAADKDPFASESASLAPSALYDLRVTMTTLMKHQSSVEELLNRETIRKTKWFQALANTTDEHIRKATKDLHKHLEIRPQKRGDLLVISMTCSDKADAAVIANEMVESFLAVQGTKAREHVASRLTRLENQRLRVDAELRSAEVAMEDVCRRYGFTDLDEHPSACPSPMIARLIRLEQQRDDCVLEMAQVKARIEELLKSSEPSPGENPQIDIAAAVKSAEAGYAALQVRLRELERMRGEAEAQKRDLHAARTQYAQRVAIRDERAQVLDAIKSQIEKLKILHDDPDTAGVRFVGRASEPLLPDSPKWRVYLLAGAILGFVLGLLHSSSRSRRQQPRPT